MKMLFVLLLVSPVAFAQFPKIADGLSGLKEVSKKVFDACQEDKSKIKACESYTEMQKLKTCLLENKDKLSDKCKASLR